MKVGDIVSWPSARGLKEGQIIAVVLAGVNVRTLLPPVTPGRRANDPRLRSPLIIHDRDRFLIRVWRSGGLHWGIPRRNPGNYDFAYYTPSVEYISRTGRVLIEGGLSDQPEETL